jgi:hypothetical protein
VLFPLASPEPHPPSRMNSGGGAGVARSAFPRSPSDRFPEQMPTFRKEGRGAGSPHIPLSASTPKRQQAVHSSSRSELQHGRTGNTRTSYDCTSCICTSFPSFTAPGALRRVHRSSYQRVARLRTTQKIVESTMGSGTGGGQQPLPTTAHHGTPSLTHYSAGAFHRNKQANRPGAK